MSKDALSLIIFVVCIGIFIWDKLPMATTAVLGCVSMVIFGVCDFKTAFGQFSSSTVILTIGVMIIGAAISETGLAKMIGGWIIQKAGDSQTKLLIGTYLVSAVMSAFLTNSAVLAIFMPIILGLSAANKKIKAKNLIMPIAFGCVIGGSATLVGSTQQMTAQGLLESAGERMFSTFSFSLVGGILVLLGLFYCLFFGVKRGEKIWGDRVEEGNIKTAAVQDIQYNRPKIMIMTGIFVLTVVFYITEWIPLAVTSSTAAVLCIITDCISQKKAIASVNWDIVGRLAGCLGLAKALETAGGTALISNGFSALVGDSLSPFLLFAILVLITQAIGEFMSNSTALLIILPIVISIAPSRGLNVYAFALGITIASGMTLSCPLASSTLGMSMSAGYKFNDYFRYGIFYDVLAYITVITTIPLFYGLTV